MEIETHLAWVSEDALLLWGEDPVRYLRWREDEPSSDPPPSPVIPRHPFAAAAPELRAAVAGMGASPPDSWRGVAALIQVPYERRGPLPSPGLCAAVPPETDRRRRPFEGSPGIFEVPGWLVPWSDARGLLAPEARRAAARTGGTWGALGEVFALADGALRPRCAPPGDGAGPSPRWRTTWSLRDGSSRRAAWIDTITRRFSQAFFSCRGFRTDPLGTWRGSGDSGGLTVYTAHQVVRAAGSVAARSKLRRARRTARVPAPEAAATDRGSRPPPRVKVRRSDPPRPGAGSPLRPVPLAWRATLRPVGEAVASLRWQLFVGPDPVVPADLFDALASAGRGALRLYGSAVRADEPQVRALRGYLQGILSGRGETAPMGLGSALRLAAGAEPPGGGFPVIRPRGEGRLRGVVDRHFFWRGTTAPVPPGGQSRI